MGELFAPKPSRIVLIWNDTQGLPLCFADDGSEHGFNMCLVL